MSPTLNSLENIKVSINGVTTEAVKNSSKNSMCKFYRHTEIIIIEWVKRQLQQ